MKNSVQYRKVALKPALRAKAVRICLSLFTAGYVLLATQVTTASQVQVIDCKFLIRNSE